MNPTLILSLSPDAQIRWMKSVWLKELENRQRQLHGKVLVEKLAEAQLCISVCDELLKPKERVR